MKPKGGANNNNDLALLIFDSSNSSRVLQNKSKKNSKYERDGGTNRLEINSHLQGNLIIPQSEFNIKNNEKLDKYKNIFDSKFLDDHQESKETVADKVHLAPNRVSNNSSKRLIQQKHLNSKSIPSTTVNDSQTVILPNGQQFLNVGAPILQASDVTPMNIHMSRNSYDENSVITGRKEVRLSDKMKRSSAKLEPLSYAASLENTGDQSTGNNNNLLIKISQNNNGRNELSNQILRGKARSTASLLAVESRIHLKNVQENSDISYFKEQKLNVSIDPGQATSTFILKNPALLLFNGNEQKKNSIYTQMYDHSHQKDKFDTDFRSIQRKVDIDNLKKPSPLHEGISTCINSSVPGGRTLDVSSINSKQHNNTNIQTDNGMKKFTSINSNNKSSNSILAKSQYPHSNQVDSLGTTMNAQALMTKPTNRNEVVDLEYWLDDMIDQVQITDQMTLKEVFGRIQVIYVACMKELVRQITIQCKDRGKLLQRVWDSYLDILEKSLVKTQTIKDDEEKDHLDEVTRIHKMYDQTIKLLEKDLLEKKNECSLLTEQNRKLQDAIAYFRKKLIVEDEELSKQQQVEEELRFELQAAINENLKLKLFQSQAETNQEETKAKAKPQAPNSSTATIPDAFTLQGSMIQINEETGKTNNQRKGHVSVVSHLISKMNRNHNYEQEEDKNVEENKQQKEDKNQVLNKFKQATLFYENDEEDEEDEDEDCDEETKKLKEQKRKEKEAENQKLQTKLKEEKNIKDLQLPVIEQFDICDQEVQTDEMNLTDNDQANQIIKKLSSNALVSEAEPNLISKYQDAYQFVRSSGMDISEKEAVLQALKGCKLQVVSSAILAELTGKLQKDNSTMKEQVLELQLQIKELEQTFQDKRIKQKKKIQSYKDLMTETEFKIKELEENALKAEGYIEKSVREKLLLQKVIYKFTKPKQENNKQGTIQEEEEEEEQQQELSASNEIKANSSGPLNSQNAEEMQENIENIVEEAAREAVNGMKSDDVVEKGQKKLLSLIENDKRPSKIFQFLSHMINHQINEIDSPLEEVQQSINENDFSNDQHSQDNNNINNKNYQKTENSTFKSIFNQSRVSVSQSLKRTYSQNTISAQKAITQLVGGVLQTKLQPLLPLSSINIFFEYVCSLVQKNEKSLKIPLNVFCYDLLLQKYGLKSLADEKIRKIMKSVLYYKQNNHRMEMISMFLGLSSNKFNENDYRHFMQGLKFFHLDYFSAASTLIPLDKCQEFVLQEFSHKLGKGVEFDQLLKKCFYYYQEQCLKTRQNIEDIFYATDLDENQSIEIWEFELLFRYVEPEKYSKQFVKEVFNSDADLINPNTEEKSLSLDGFITMSIERELFTESKCKQFLSVPTSPDVNNLEDLKVKHKIAHKEIKNRFLKANQLIGNTKIILKKLFKHIQEPNFNRKNSLWVSYKLLELDSKRVILDFEAERLQEELLPLELNMLAIISKKYEDIL